MQLFIFFVNMSLCSTQTPSPLEVEQTGSPRSPRLALLRALDKSLSSSHSMRTEVSSIIYHNTQTPIFTLMSHSVNLKFLIDSVCFELALQDKHA